MGVLRNSLMSLIIIGLLGGCSKPPPSSVLKNRNITNPANTVVGAKPKQHLRIPMEKQQIARAPTQSAPELIDPNSLLGQNERDIAKILGVPGFYRVENTVRIWQYRVGLCVLDLVFYSSQGEYRVNYHKFRHVNKNSNLGDICHIRIKPRNIRNPFQ